MPKQERSSTLIPISRQVVGVEPPDLLGKELWEIGLFADIEENKQAFRTLQTNGYVQYDDLPLRNARGETVEVEFVSNIYPQNNHVVAQCNIRSIAERRLREQARILADESRRKDEFLAMLSHELRNPLAPIRSATHLLRLQERAGSENSTQREAREVIERQVAHLSRLVNDLLEVSRIVSGNVRIQMSLLDMREVVKHAMETVRPLADQRGHSLLLTLPDDAVWVRADATRLEEVVSNLVINAVKYTKADGQGRIEVSLGIEEEATRAVLRVRDNGDGLDAEPPPWRTSFDLFAQGKRSLDRSQGGLGIGLTLVHSLLKLQRGTVEAKSDGPGRGSEFIVRLPLSLPDQGMDSSKSDAMNERTAHGGTAKRGPEETGKHEGRPLRILVVDDNLDHVSMVAGALRANGHSVQTAYTGPAGLQAALDWRPDIVLLDIGLPELNGYEIAKRLRGDARGAVRNMRLIAISGYGRPEDVKLALESGFDAHLTKPFDSEQLDRLIESSIHH